MSEIDSLSKLLIREFGEIHDSSEFEKKWASLELKYDDEVLILALRQILEKERFSPLVQLILPKLKQPNKDLADLIIWLAEKIGRDMAAGMFYNGLIGLGRNNPDGARGLVKIVSTYNSSYAGFIVGLLLGGICEARRDAFPTVIEKLRSATPDERISGFVAVCVIGGDSEQQLSPDLRKQLVLSAKAEESQEVLMRVPAALVAAQTGGDKEVEDTLDLLSKNEDAMVRYSLASALLPDKKLDVGQKLRLLTNCAKSLEPGLVDEICDCLYQLREEADTEDVMKLIRIMTEGSSYVVPQMIPWVLGEYGRRSFTDIADIIKGWYEKAQGKEKLSWELILGPGLIGNAGSANEVELAKVLSEWSKNPLLRNLVLNTTDYVLRDVHGREEPSDEFLNSCISYLSVIAKDEGISPEEVMKSEERKIWKCGKLLQAIRAEEPQYNFVLARENLRRLKNINAFLGVDWISRIERGRMQPATLLRLLSRSQSEIRSLSEAIEKETSPERRFVLLMQRNDVLMDLALLEHMDELLSRIRLNEQGIGDLRDKLLGEEFVEGLSELELISRLRRKYRVECYPNVERIVDGKTKRSKLEALVEIEGQEVLVETVTPELMAELRYLGAATIPNRLAQIVWREFQEQLSGMVKQNDVIIVLDRSRSEISNDEATAYMEGPESWVLQLDKETGRPVGSFVERKEEESMHKMAPGMNMILGVLVYDRVIGKDGKYHLRGKFHSNPGASGSSKSPLIEGFKRSFLG